MASNRSDIKRFMKGLTADKLSKMPDSRKKAFLIKCERLLEDIGKNKLGTYNVGKVHLKQVQFHRSLKRKRLMIGGNRTGKTVSGAVECVYWARGNHPYQNIERATDGWVVSVTNEVQRDVAQAEVLKWLNPDWIIDIGVRDGSKSDIDNAILDYITVQSECGGVSRIGFKSCEQGRKKFQGTSKDYIWFDEEPDKDIYDECLMRIMDKEGSIWLTMTPLMGLTFIYELLYLNERNDPEVQTIQMSWEDNPFLPEREIQQMVLALTEEEQEARRYGNFVAMTGLVYNEFNPDYHILFGEYDYKDKMIYLIDQEGERYSKIYKRWYDKISVDVGYTNPTAVHFYAEDDEGSCYCLAEHFKAQKPVSYHAEEIKKIARALDWPKTNGGYTGLVDTASNQKTSSSEESTREKYTRQKIFLANVDKSVWDGIMTVKEYLKMRPYPDDKAWPKGKPKFFIVRVENWPYDNVEIVKEIKKYRWAEKKSNENQKEAPSKKFDHCMDELRYYLHSKPKDKLFLDHEKSLSYNMGRMSLTEMQDEGLSADTTQPFRAGRNNYDDPINDSSGNGGNLHNRFDNRLHGKGSTELRTRATNFNSAVRSRRTN